MKAVTVREIDTFVIAQAEKGLKPSTINRRLAAIISFYTFMADEDLELVCPVLPRRHLLREQQRLPRPVPEADLHRFFAVIEDDRDKAMFLLMLRCGLRLVEVARLRLTDLYLAETPARILVYGKNSKERTAYLSPQVEMALRVFLTPRMATDSDVLFVSYQGAGMSTTAIHKRLMRYRKTAGISITAHQLRHTFANDLIMADVPVTTIQKLMGHSWLTTTQTYLAANDRKVQADFATAIQTLEGLAMNDDLLTRVTERYDTTLHRAHRGRLLPDTIEPQPTSQWLPENIQLLARYYVWLQEENSTQNCIKQIYLPMAGHILGLNLKPHAQLNLTTDLDKAMTYIHAKQLSQSWTDICRRALNRFRRFLQYERQIPPLPFQPLDVDVQQYQTNLPTWLIEQLQHYQHQRQVRWRPARLRESIRQFWRNHTQIWRWLFTQADVTRLPNIRRHHILTYMDGQIDAGYAVSSINHDLRAFQATLGFLQEQGFQIPIALFRIPTLKNPDRLPRFLRDEDVCRLQQDLEQRVQKASTPAQRENSLLDRACFYLMWHGGLRVSEVEEVRLDDLNLAQSRLMVRQGKGMKDRTIYLTEPTILAIQAYLPLRGQSHTDHLFIYRHKPLSKDLVRTHLKAMCGNGWVSRSPPTNSATPVPPNWSMLAVASPPSKLSWDIARLNSTLVYARVHDRTVREDYYAAMTVIEKRLEIPPPPICHRQIHNTKPKFQMVNNNTYSLWWMP